MTQFKKAIIIGDIHGHYDRFVNGLKASGIDDDYHIPKSCLVIQVGDLIHGDGQSQVKCLQLADKLLASNPENYVQLIGNHEAHYLAGPDISQRKTFRQLPPAAIKLLKQLFKADKLSLAYALKTKEYGEVLITHGGLTAGFWQIINSPDDATTAADNLNQLLTNPQLAFKPGAMITGGVNFSAGVICPRTGAEVAQSWLNQNFMPFHQIHGHESIWLWQKDDYHTLVTERVKQLSSVDKKKRQVITNIFNKRLWSIDAKLDCLAHEENWESLVLELN